MGIRKWEMGNGKWKMENGKWEMGNGKWENLSPERATSNSVGQRPTN
jgi:hypothetical protein